MTVHQEITEIETAPATLNRRRMLLGLAAAASAAAAVSISEAATSPTEATPAENPVLLALSAELDAIVDKCIEATSVEKEIRWRWYNATPRAPDELTVAGTAGPFEKGQPGEAEPALPYFYMWRKGEEFPRRVVLKVMNSGGRSPTPSAACVGPRKRGMQPISWQPRRSLLRGDGGLMRIPFRHGLDWHGQIAASVQPMREAGQRDGQGRRQALPVPSGVLRRRRAAAKGVGQDVQAR